MELIIISVVVSVQNSFFLSRSTLVKAIKIMPTAKVNEQVVPLCDSSLFFTFLQRKRLSKGVKCVFSPDDVKSRFQKVGRESSSLSFMSSEKSWKKCGESFLDVPEMKVDQ